MVVGVLRQTAAGGRREKAGRNAHHLKLQPLFFILVLLLGLAYLKEYLQSYRNYSYAKTNN